MNDATITLIALNNWVRDTLQQSLGATRATF